MGDGRLNVSVVGSGYVGTVSAACFADLGHNVVCIDIDAQKVDMINRGEPPIYEEGLEELLKKHAGKKIKATSNYHEAVIGTDVSFICVGTPSDAQGNIDLSIIKAASKSLGEAISLKNNYHVVVVKSTVVPETTRKYSDPHNRKSLWQTGRRRFWCSYEPRVFKGRKSRL